MEIGVLCLLLICLYGATQASSIKKRSSEQVNTLSLENELHRVKRLDQDRGLSRTKRRDLEENGELSRVKRHNTEDSPSLSREKRRDLEVEGLSRMKREELDGSPSLSREKRRDFSEDGLHRVKRTEMSETGLSREKRKDLDEEQLFRVKRDDEVLMRQKRMDGDLQELSREERKHRKRRDAAEKSNVEKKDVDDLAESQDEIPDKKTSVELNLSKSPDVEVKKKSPETSEGKIKRKRGYWEKRTREDYLLHRANKRGKFHKRRYMNKRGRGRFMKKKSLIAKQKLHRNKQQHEDVFFKKSLAKNDKRE